VGAGPIIVISGPKDKELPLKSGNVGRSEHKFSFSTNLICHMGFKHYLHCSILLRLILNYTLSQRETREADVSHCFHNSPVCQATANDDSRNAQAQADE